MKRSLSMLIIFLTILSTELTAQQSAPIVVNAGQSKAAIQPTMWGIFFEDINMAADGGIYAELVKNRSFEFNMPLMGWKEQKKDDGDGAVFILNSGSAHSANPRFAEIEVKTANGSYGLQNEGFRGMGIKKDQKYNFSVLARLKEGSSATLAVSLLNAKGEPIGSASLNIAGTDWKHYAVSFNATATEPKGAMNILFNGKSKVDIDMVSLFPQDTWKQRPGGLRADLVQLLADLKPGFIRFPGGCIVEGRELATRYQWKKTIGDVDDRQVIVNRWNTEFRHRLTPDYFQSFGLGFFEYFQLAEDIGAEPLPILNCGMACQFNTSELVPVDQLDPYLQDALDLIEFANGSVDTKWGKLRTALGHPAPFHLKMIGVGNEQWGEQYVDRYKVFQKAIKDKYPDIRIVTSVGPSPTGPLFDYLNPIMRGLHADILDEHYYSAPEWFQKNVTRYDNYDRKGPRIFAGEYAAQSKAIASPDNKNNWLCALSEAAFMTGLERNADVVNMASYAPLFAHVDGWQWTPDLIWFDNLRSYGSDNYYVQKLFSNNKGTNLLTATSNNLPLTGQDGLFASACLDKKTNEVILKLVNTSANAQVKEIDLEGVKSLGPKASVTVLRTDDLDKVNSLDDPMAVSPAQQEVNVNGKKLSLSAAPYSLTVMRVKIM